MQDLGTTGDLRAGHRLGRYLIERELGRGGMGAVFVALDEHLGRRVALKVVAPAHAADVGFRARFEREARIAATLEHPNVVPVYDVGESDGRVFISMRLIDGDDLASEIGDRGALAPARVARLVTQVSAALDAAHRAGLVHRDVKPANVLLTGRGMDEHAYLTDFGLSRDAASESGLTATGEWLGTPDYAAPEQIEGGPIDARTDVYALACMTFHLLTGRVPFSGATPAKIHGHLSLAPPRVSAFDHEITAAVDDVVARGMAKDWRGRPASAGQFAREFGAAITQTAPSAEAVTAATERAPEATVRAPRTPRQPRSPRTAEVWSDVAAGRRSAWRLIAAVAILVAVLVAGVGAAVALTGGGQTETTSPQTASPQTVTVGSTVIRQAPPAETRSITTQEAPAPTSTTMPKAPAVPRVTRFTTGQDAGQSTLATACNVAGTVLTCWTPNDGFTLVLPRHGAAFRARAEEALHRGRQPGYPAIGFGERWRSGGFACVSRKSGLTCANSDGHGWTLPRYRGLPAYF